MSPIPAERTAQFVLDLNDARRRAEAAEAKLERAMAEVANLRMQYEASQGALSDLLTEHRQDAEALQRGLAAAQAIVPQGSGEWVESGEAMKRTILHTIRAAALAAEPTPPAAGIVTPNGITPGGMSTCPECQRWGLNPAGLCTNAFHEPTPPVEERHEASHDGVCGQRGPRLGDDVVFCADVRGHDGPHRAHGSHGNAKWPNDAPTPPAATRCRASHPTNPSVIDCDLWANHDGPHHSWTGCAGSHVEWEPTPPAAPHAEDGPHSRACGPFCRGHGKECHRNCPTCGGYDLLRPAPVADPSGTGETR